MRIVLIRMIASCTDRTNAIVESAGPTRNVRGPEVSEWAHTTSHQLLINSSPTKHKQIGKRLTFKLRIPAHTINLDLMLVSSRDSCPVAQNSNDLCEHSLLRSAHKDNIRARLSTNGHTPSKVQTSKATKARVKTRRKPSRNSRTLSSPLTGRGCLGDTKGGAVDAY